MSHRGAGSSDKWQRRARALEKVLDAEQAKRLELAKTLVEQEKLVQQLVDAIPVLIAALYLEDRQQQLAVARVAAKRIGLPEGPPPKDSLTAITLAQILQQGADRA